MDELLDERLAHPAGLGEDTALRRSGGRAYHRTARQALHQIRRTRGRSGGAPSHVSTANMKWRTKNSTAIVANVPQEERAQIDAVQRRLAQKCEDLPRDHVAAVVHRAYARFHQSKL